jgi:hypothetical protein
MKALESNLVAADCGDKSRRDDEEAANENLLLLLRIVETRRLAYLVVDCGDKSRREMMREAARNENLRCCC